MPKSAKVKPMLATLVAEPFDRAGWLFEYKWDGYRAIAETKGGKAELYSRNGTDFTKKYAPVAQAFRGYAHRAVFDGEIVAFDQEGRPDFHALQNYDRQEVPIRYAIFDLLELDGTDLRALPLAERKKLLKRNFPKGRVFIWSDYIEEKGKVFFKEVVSRGLEGMVAKDGASAYLEGRRSRAWLKVKNANSQEAVVVGFTAPRGWRKYLGALVLAAYEGEKLRYIGHSGGGFTDAELKSLHDKLSRKKIAASPLKEKVPVNAPITWVKPDMVVEIGFSEWTPSGQMRHPVFKGVRKDKKAKEVRRELPRGPDPGASPPLTHGDKVFWPKERITKGDVYRYYEKMAPIILPYLADRPESLLRQPDGINGPSFFQKNITMKVPDFVETREVKSESRGKIRYLLCQNKETLLYLANLGVIEINPWNSRLGALDRPDYMIIDLDPGANPFETLVAVAREAKKILDKACENHFVKTSGKKGLHILIPLGAKYDYATIRTFAELHARIIHKRLPELTTIERNPKKRGGKIYLDYLQNSRGQTLAAPYSLRPWPGATVSTPLRWEEVRKGLDPKKFTMKTIWRRLDRLGDIWRDFLANPVDLPKAIECLNKEFS